MEIKELKEVIMKIEKRKAIIAKNRDELRDIFDDLSDCLDSFNDGIDLLETGVKDIECAIDSISEVV